MDPATGNILKTRFVNYKFVKNVFSKLTLNSTQNSKPLTFKAPETLTANPDPRTSRAYSKVIKLFNLKDLADELPDGFYSGPRILRNPLQGTGNTLLVKRSVASSSRPPKLQWAATTIPKVFATEVAPDPLTLLEANASSDWRK